MKVYLDNEPLASPDGTLTAVLSRAVERARERGRIVVEVQADGAQVPDEHLESPPATDPYASEIRLLSAEPKALVKTTMSDAADLLQQAEADQRRAAELLQVGQMREAVDMLPTIFGAWDAARRAIEDGCTLMGDDTNSVTKVDDEALEIELAVQLDGVRQSLSRGDWTSLADILAYDLTEQASRWRTSMLSYASKLR